MGDEAGEVRQYGDAALYGVCILTTLYSFYFVVDLRLVPAVRVLCERLHIPDDVAGATVLGAALNAPELFTAAISSLVLKDEVGVGVVMGSWNFNILLITGFSSLLARKRLRSRQLKVEWTFLQRDVYFYIVSVILIVVVCHDGLVTWQESISMTLFYVAYVVVCALSGVLARWLCPGSHKARVRKDLTLSFDEGGHLDFNATLRSIPDASPALEDALMGQEEPSPAMGEDAVAPNSGSGISTPLLASYPAEVSARLALSRSAEGRLQRSHSSIHPGHRIAIDARLVEAALDDECEIPLATDALQRAEEVELEAEAEEYHAKHLLAWPGAGASWWEKLAFVVNIPFNAFAMTIPWNEKIYAVTAVVATVWLALISYILSAASSRFGRALLIPDEVIGLTLDAVGTSMPNLLAAVMASKQGKVMSAICQAFGSNTFDALVAFGLVQGLRCCANGLRPVVINAKGVARDGVVDVAIVVAYVALLWASRMRLTRTFGYLNLIAYCAWLGTRLTVLY